MSIRQGCAFICGSLWLVQAVAAAGSSEIVPGKMHRTLTGLLDTAGPSGLIHAWILLDPRDKLDPRDQVPGAPRDLEAAVRAVAGTYHPRAIERRRLRRTLPGLFDYRDVPVPQDYVRQIEETGARIRVVSRWLNAVSVEANRTQLERIEQLDFVRKMQPVRKGRRVPPPGAVPVPGGFDAAVAGGSFYGEADLQLAQINLINLHLAGFTGQGVIVGILDTGFVRTHNAFNEPGHVLNVVTEWDFVNGDPVTSIETGDPPTQHRHGTYILGVLGAYKPQELVGAAYDASFILCKTEDIAGEYPGEEDNYVAGLEFIEANGGDMATSSLGYIDWYTQDDLDGLTAVTTIAVNIATGNGVHCSTAAGNASHDADPNTSNLIAPADALEVVTCGAVNSAGAIAGFSSDGPTADGRVKPEVLALGENTRTVWPDTDIDYVGINGTSLSTPLVAGALACLIEAHPDWTVEQMRRYLMFTAEDYVANGEFDPLYIRGYGIIDAFSASEEDCDGNGVADSIDIADGTHLDCNANLIPDLCDIAQGMSPDIDANGIPDECTQPIPAVSSWGAVAMTLLLFVAGTIAFRRGGESQTA